jgi:hypothetical protein
MVQSLEVILFNSFGNILQGFIEVIPKLFWATVVFIIGWIIAVVVGRLFAQLISLTNVDRALQKLGIAEPLSRAGLSLNTGAFIGGLIKWFVLIVFFVASMDIVGLRQVNAFLKDVVLLYLPNVIVAALMLVAAAVLAGVMQKVVTGSAKAARLPSAAFLGGVAKWAIWIFAILAALYQLNIAAPLIQSLFTGFVAMVAIAGGIAFGLGGKDTASRYLSKLAKDISERD